MGLVNLIFRSLIQGRMRTIEAFMHRPHEVQRSVLKKLIGKAQDTKFGREHRFSEIRSYADFVRNVPIRDYNGLKPWIEETMKGDSDILWPGQTQWFAKSSGTTDDRSKFIPMTSESLEECHFKAGKDLFALYYNLNPDAQTADGKGLVLGGSHQVNPLNDKSKYGDLSAVLMQNLPFWAELMRTPDRTIALMDKWEEKIERMAQATINQDITHIMGVPTWTVVLIKRLFDLKGTDNLAEIWPNLGLYVHGGVSFTPYRDLFSKLIRKEGMHYIETYNASEGFFGIQDSLHREELLLMLDYGIFYEFIPFGEVEDENPQAVPLEAVVPGKVYSLVISTNGGLWRYAIGDTVRFTSTDPYRIVISGRTRHFINAFGEELIVENADRAMASACEETSCTVSDYTAAPVFFTEGGNGAHEWIIEFDQPPQNLEGFALRLDTHLRELNSDYDAKRRKDIALRLPIIHQAQTGTFYQWMKSRDKLGGQHKVPRLSNERTHVEGLLEQMSAKS